MHRRSRKWSGPAMPWRHPARTTGWLPLVLGASLLLVGAVPTSPAGVGQASRAVCTWTATYTVMPGITLSTANHHIDTHGPTGRIRCEGAIRGHEATSIGTVNDAGPLRGNALQGSGTSTQKVMIPTSGGTVTLVFKGTYTYGPGSGTKEYRTAAGDTFSGVFEFRPTEGDGVTTPVTEIIVKAQMVMNT